MLIAIGLLLNKLNLMLEWKRGAAEIAEEGHVVMKKRKDDFTGESHCCTFLATKPMNWQVRISKWPMASMASERHTKKNAISDPGSWPF